MDKGLSIQLRRLLVVLTCFWSLSSSNSDLATGQVPSTQDNKPDSNVIIFVHGFTGSAGKSWGQFPELLRGDPELKGYEVYQFDYRTGLFGRNPTIEVVAESLKTEVYERFKDKRNVFFIAHSMGGLVVQAMIVQELKLGHAKELKRIKHIILFGTPNFGAQVPRFLQWWNTQAKELDTNADFIYGLLRDWAIYAHNPDVEEGSKNHKLKMKDHVTAVFGSEDVIVPRPSAIGVFETTRLVRGTHTSMKEFDTPLSMAYKIVKNNIYPPPAIEFDTDLPFQTSSPSSNCREESPPASPNRPKTVVSLFHPDDPSSASFSTFKGILRSKLDSIAQSVKRGSNLSYLDYLALISLCKEPPTLGEIQRGFAVSPSLEYVSGTVFPNQVMGTTVYFDKSLGSLSKVDFQFPLTTKEYGAITDHYSMATLYALALDAKRLHYPSTVIQSFLAKALTISKDIKNKSPETNNLVAAIESELQKLNLK